MSATIEQSPAAAARLPASELRRKLDYAGLYGRHLLAGTIFESTPVPVYLSGDVPHGRILAIFAEDFYEPEDLAACADESLPDLLWFSDKDAYVLRRPNQTVAEAPRLPEGPVVAFHIEGWGRAAGLPWQDAALTKYIDELPNMTQLIARRLKDYHNVLVPPVDVMPTPTTVDQWWGWLKALDYQQPCLKDPQTTRNLLKALRKIVREGALPNPPHITYSNPLSGTTGFTFTVTDGTTRRRGAITTVQITGYVRREVRAYRTETASFAYDLEIPEDVARGGEDAIQVYCEDHIDGLDYHGVDRRADLDDWEWEDSDWETYDTDNHEVSGSPEFSQSDVEDVAADHAGHEDEE